MIDIKKFEAMAKLDLPEAERQLISGRVNCLLNDFSVIEKIDTSAAEPLITVLDIQNIMRDDTPEKTVTREELLSNAPDQHDGYFRVPKTLD